MTDPHVAAYASLQFCERVVNSGESSRQECTPLGIVSGNGFGFLIWVKLSTLSGLHRAILDETSLTHGGEIRNMATTLQPVSIPQSLMIILVMWMAGLLEHDDPSKVPDSSVDGPPPQKQATSGQSESAKPPFSTGLDRCSQGARGSAVGNLLMESQ